jgi:hypothetical protein
MDYHKRRSAKLDKETYVEVIRLTKFIGSIHLRLYILLLGLGSGRISIGIVIGIGIGLFVIVGELGFILGLLRGRYLNGGDLSLLGGGFGLRFRLGLGGRRRGGRGSRSDSWTISDGRVTSAKQTYVW